MSLLQKTENGKTLFCVAYIKLVEGVWRGDVAYTHAENAGHAKNAFCRTNPDRRKIQVVAVGPAVGFFRKEEDEEGKILFA